MVCRKATIKKCKGSDKESSKDLYCVYDRKGEKLLGRHPSKEAAKKQLAAIEISKHSKHLSKITNYLFLFEQ